VLIIFKKYFEKGFRLMIFLFQAIKNPLMGGVKGQ